uniref:65-kDa microtubule-associated protein 8 n=1 Tax=Oryza nivara TaxID=4536 RepID=A0A0E0IEZ8_ORYNI
MGSLKMTGKAPCAALPESSCAYLLQELKMIWDEVGQEENERERILQEIEQECQEVYRRKPEKMTGTLKEQLNSITPALQEMQMRKEARLKQFIEVQTEIQRIASEIAGRPENEAITVNQEDLSLKKLEEHQSELQRLKREKSDRLCKVEEYKVLIHNYAKIMGMDPSKILSNVHTSLLDGANDQQTKNISDDILNKLNTMVQQLKEEKNQRMDKLHSLGKALTKLWNILDTNMEERRPYGEIKIYSMTSGSSMLGPGSLTLETIQKIESEVQRLDHLKASKMKELFMIKQTEIKEICKKSHMDMPYQTEMNKIMDVIMSGDVDHDDLLKTMDEYIYKVKEEATSRKEIMDKVEKWMASCDEERWLEEYSRDERRYSISRGAHKHLKRAERARIIVNKIPGLVELLMAKTEIWEQEREKVFYYDELPLLAMLKDYMLTLKEKEEEKYRQWENKKVQTQLARRHENSFILRPNTSCSRPSSRGFNTSPGSSTIWSSRLPTMVQQPSADNSSAEKDVHIRKVRNRSMQRTLGNNRSISISYEDKTPSLSAIKQGVSPI